ncbi:hypothetical protein B0J14DRAFT_367642 [Halenospora varia]|nr:hypothetical protein B0J14DRAFT_367642 [Halenospora varia]
MIAVWMTVLAIMVLDAVLIPAARMLLRSLFVRTAVYRRMVFVAKQEPVRIACRSVVLLQALQHRQRGLLLLDDRLPRQLHL